MEYWVNIKGYEGLYLISNFGNIISLSDRYRDKRSTSKDIYLKHILGTNGYYKVSLNKNGKTKQISIHRLVAKHFIDNPDNKPQVNHKDGNKLNNNISNLEWVTAKENSIHAWNINLNKPCIPKFGKHNHRSKRIKQILPNGDIKVWDSMMSAKRAGYDTSCICRCCKGESKIHKNSKWEYTNLPITENTFSETVEDNEVKKICPTCNKEFKTLNSKKTYCSRKCGKKVWDKNYQNKIKEQE